MAEGIIHLLAEGRVIAIPHIDAFVVVVGVDLAIPVGIRAREAPRRRHILIAHGEGLGQLTARIDSPRQQVGDGIARLLPRHVSQQDGIDLVLPGAGVHDAADVEQHHYLLAKAVESTADVVDERLFHIGEQIIPLPVQAILPLRRVATKGDDGDIIAGGISRYLGLAQGWLRTANYGRDAAKVARALVLLEKGAIEVREPGVDAELPGQPVHHIDGIGRVHVAAAGAALEGIDLSDPEGGQLDPLRQGQAALLVFQQHHAITGSLTR
ncbi:hypothetical protein D3C75_705900 [compost metagenome]